MSIHESIHDDAWKGARIGPWNVGGMPFGQPPLVVLKACLHAHKWRIAHLPSDRCRKGCLVQKATANRGLWSRLTEFIRAQDLRRVAPSRSQACTRESWTRSNAREHGAWTDLSIPRLHINSGSSNGGGLGPEDFQGPKVDRTHAPARQHPTRAAGRRLSLSGLPADAWTRWRGPRGTSLSAAPARGRGRRRRGQSRGPRRRPTQRPPLA